MLHKSVLGLGLSAVFFATLTTLSTQDRSSAVGSDETPSAQTKLVPVDRSMHEFMEYYFQPTYLRLKGVMAASSAGNPNWKAIKADSLILAEGGNLLLLRTPLRDPARWNEASVAVRESAGELYKAARKRDVDAARKSYEQMLTKCNSCHKPFAAGKHMLAP